MYVSKRCIIIITRIYSVFFSLLNYSFVCKYINVLVLAHRSKSLVAQEISSINNAFIILITIIKHCHASRPCMLFLCFGKGGLVLIPGLNAERRAIERSARKYSHVKVDASWINFDSRYIPISKGVKIIKQISQLF